MQNAWADRPKTGIEIHRDPRRGGPGADGYPVKDADAGGPLVEWSIRLRRDRYAERVIDDPNRFDAIEVHYVCEFSDCEGSSYEKLECDPATPSTFSVYAHLKVGGIDCSGDFSQRSDALAYGSELANTHQWPVFDYIPFKRQKSS